MKLFKNKLKRSLLILIIFMLVFSAKYIALAQESEQSGEAIEISNLDNLLWSIVKTIQFYTLPFIAISMVFLGIKLILSSDDPSARADIRSWMGKILIGGFIIFGASSISTIIKNSLL